MNYSLGGNRARNFKWDTLNIDETENIRNNLEYTEIHILKDLTDLRNNRVQTRILSYDIN